MFANMTDEQDRLDAGNCQVRGRWHDLGSGSGFAVAGAQSEEEVYAWANNWAGMCSCSIIPVLTDQAARAVIKSKPDYEDKLRKVKSAMNPRKSIIYWLGYPCSSLAAWFANAN